MMLDHKLMAIAQQLSSRATCDRLHVGSVVARGGAILTEGWNTALDGLPTCDEVGHDLVNNSCARVIHAEAKAIANAARHGINLGGATIYVTASPCWPCMRLIATAGIRRVVYGSEFYRDVDRIEAAARAAGILVERVRA
jgi:dCMP deaminase